MWAIVRSFKAARWGAMMTSWELGGDIERWSWYE